MTRVSLPRRGFFADHGVLDNGPISGRNQNAGSIVVREMTQRVFAKRTACGKKGS